MIISILYVTLQKLCSYTRTLPSGFTRSLPVCVLLNFIFLTTLVQRYSSSLFIYLLGSAKNDLLVELAMLKHIGHHQNIVNFLGCCTQSGMSIFFFCMKRKYE